MNTHRYIRLQRDRYGHKNMYTRPYFLINVSLTQRKFVDYIHSYSNSRGSDHKQFLLPNVSQP